MLCLLSALLAVPFLALTPSTARAAELSPAGKQAFQEIASCVAEKKVLLASIVVDESSSLKRSDPDAKRASAVMAIVDALAELEESGGADVTVEAELATFGAGVHTASRLGIGDGQARRRPAAGRGLGNSAHLTDYREALNGAQDSINSHAQALGKQQPCSVILWFTDGRLDVGPDQTQDEAARDQICDPNGIADSIRTAGTHVIALALFSNDSPSPRASASVRRSDNSSERQRKAPATALNAVRPRSRTVLLRGPI